MVEATAFEELIRRVRSGDQEAAAELVHRYEPAIRRAVRFRLAQQGLATLFDSIDISQSVLGSFFVRAASGQYDLENPDQLQGLLVAMARKKLAFQARKQRAQRRDYRRAVSGSAAERQFVARGTSPSGLAEARELLQEVRRRLSPEELLLVDLRTQGHPWADIAFRLDNSAEALRKKLTRALDRVARQLGLDES